MKKNKPITIRRSEIRKSVRKPMPPPAQQHEDKRRKKVAKEIERESREEA